MTTIIKHITQLLKWQHNWHLYVGIVLLATFSIWIRLLALDTYPSNITADEYDTMRTVITLWGENQDKPAFNWNGSSLLNPYLIGLGWFWGGQTFVAIKYASIAMSTIAVVTLFIIGLRVSKSFILSFSLALACSANPAFLNFSRSAWENIFNAFPTLLLAYYIYKIESKKFISDIDLALISVCLTLSVYFYHPGKVVFVVFLLFWMSNVIIQKKWKLLIQTLLALTAVCLLSIPYMVCTLQDPINGIHRITTVSIFAQNNAEMLLQKNIETNALALFHWENNNVRYGPLGTVFPFPIQLALLLLVPLIVPRYKSSFLFWAFSFLIVQILSNNTPDLARGIHLMGVYHFVIMLGLIEFKRLVKHSKRSILIIHLSFVLVTIGSGYLGLTRYFEYISDEHTAHMRRPAVHMSTYETWKDTMYEQLIRSGTIEMNASQWEDLYEIK